MIELQPKNAVRNNNCILMTSRFNNKTYSENEKYRKQHNKIGCVYCTEQRTSQSIKIDDIMFVLEMNNDTNKIMGIGMVRNRTTNMRHLVYEDYNYNVHHYVGKYRIDRTNMNPNEEIIMKVLDILCFKGSYHMKRGFGLLAFPRKYVQNMKTKLDIVEFVRTMFKTRINNNV